MSAGCSITDERVCLGVADESIACTLCIRRLCRRFNRGEVTVDEMAAALGFPLEVKS